MRGAGRKDRVRVDRDDGGRADQAFRVARMHREGRAVSAGEEIVELRQLAALALPASPESIGRVTGPSAVEEHEGPVAGVAVVQTVDAGAQRGRRPPRPKAASVPQQSAKSLSTTKRRFGSGIGQPVRLDMVEKRADLAGTAKITGSRRPRGSLRAGPASKSSLGSVRGGRTRVTSRWVRVTARMPAGTATEGYPRRSRLVRRQPSTACPEAAGAPRGRNRPSIAK